MDFTINIKGLDEVRAALQEAGPKLARSHLRKALQEGGQVFEDAAKRRAPVLKEETARRKPGELRDSIDTRVTMSSKEDAGTAHVGPVAQKGKGSQQPGVYGLFVEFGSIHGAAQPFMRPAFDAVGFQAQEAFAKVLKAGLETLKKK